MFLYKINDVKKKLNKSKNSKWIKSWINCGPNSYTEDAWNYLVELAKNDGITEDTISHVLEKRKYSNSWKGFIEELAIVLVVVAICVLGLTNINNITVLAILSILLTIAAVVYIEKRKL